MDSFKVRFAHAEHSKVSEYNITIFNLMLRPVGCHVHSIEFFDETAFPKEGTRNSQTTGWDNAFICKLNNNVLIGVRQGVTLILTILFKFCLKSADILLHLRVLFWLTDFLLPKCCHEYYIKYVSKIEFFNASTFQCKLELTLVILSVYPSY